MVSVIIPTLNAERQIHGLLDSLKGQSIPCEIIVIDSSSSDSTVRIAESYGVKTIIIKRDDFDHGGTRNLAVSNAGGDIIVFFTQDALPENRHVLENLLEPLQDPLIAASYGRQISRTGAKPGEKFARIFNYPEAPFVKGREDIPVLGIKTFFFSDVCSAIRRKEFEKTGGFTEKLIMNEDMLFAFRLISEGYKIAYVPDARVIHSHDYSLREQFSRYFDIGVFLRKNLYQLIRLKTGNTGAMFLREGFRYFSKNKACRCLPYLILESVFRYAGYRLGLHYTLLPNAVRKKFSMHGNYWKNHPPS